MAMNLQRKPSHVPAGSPDASGRVRFDERGNAIWETWRGRQLEHPGLSVVEDDAPRSGPALNVKGGRIGYNPYESGMVKKKDDQKPKKKDLRALSQWIQMQKATSQKD